MGARRSPRPVDPVTWGPFAAILVLLLTMFVGGASASGHSATVRPPGAAVHLGWSPLALSAPPHARAWSRMAFDAADNYTVLFGGYAWPTFYNETWIFKAGNWTQLYPTSSPSVTTGMQLVYDPALKGVLEFGGQAPYGTSFSNQTWLFRSGNWTQLSPTISPPARSSYMMAFDTAADRMVLFGGLDSSSSGLGDTWTFNGTTWSKVHTRYTPEGRAGGALIYDGVTRSVLLVTGTNATYGATTGTWSFNGRQWSALAHVNSAPRLSYAESATAANGTPLLFGGGSPSNSTLYNQTYEFYGGAWHEVRTGRVAPSARNNAAFDYDGALQRFLLFGGFNGSGYALSYLNDSWVLR